ncbi:MAG: TonB-dependent receptor [Prolixibacteraceae bacterium]
MRLQISLVAGLILFMQFSSYANPNIFQANAHLQGKITDKSSGEALPGVNIYFPGLKTGTQTNVDGTYFIGNLPAASLLVQVSFLGYKMQSKQLDLAVSDTQDFELEESATEISEVIVTGQSGGMENNRTPSPIAVVPRTQLLQNSATNIIDALSQVPGISQVSTGVGISKPVIRGMGYNRVVVVNDGIRQEGQQWGDEHGIEIDENSVYRVEILKGPASLAFGSDAMAGVINLISAPTLPEGSVTGNLNSNFQTNNGLISYSANLEGNKHGFIWNTRYSNKIAQAYQNKFDGPVYNSGFRENAFGTMLGLNRSWGFSHLHLSIYAMEPGIVEGERDSLSGKFLKTTILNDGTQMQKIADDTDFNSYHPDAPFQKINHYKAVWNSTVYLGQSNLELTLGFQQNRRKEFTTPTDYGLYFLLNTANYDIKYTLPEWKNWKFTGGISGMWQQSENKGTEFLVPAYRLFDYGLFAVANRNIGDFTISGGFRYDRRSEKSDELYQNQAGEHVDPADPDAQMRFSAFNQTFDGLSGSIGASYQISQLVYTKVNISQGYRAPNIAELGSNGIHEGTQRYEIGNQNLKPETSLQFDYSIGLNTTHVSTELNIFSNLVDHYIFSHQVNSVSEGINPDQNIDVFEFTQGNAHLYGGEFQLDIHPHPLDWLHFENTFSMVNGTLQNQPESSHYLPFIPAPHWNSEIKTEFDQAGGFLSNVYFKAGIEKTWEQNHFYAAYGTETSTPGYTLLNMGAGADFVYHKKTIFSFYVSANNLTDVAYQSHLSRLKYTAINRATGRTGIYNQGRNISFKLLIPIDFNHTARSN